MRRVTFEVLEKPVGTLDLLLYLFRHGKTNIMEILAGTGMHRETFYSAKERLTSLGFAYEEETATFPVQKAVGLTRSGEAIARALLPASELLSAATASLEEELVAAEREGNPGTSARRVEILAVLIDREFGRGRWDRAESGSRTLIELARASADKKAEARGRLGLGRILQKRDRHDEVVRELGESLRLADEIGEAAVGWEAEYLIGADLERRAEWAQALDRFSEAEARAPDPLAAARARQGRARILAKRGRAEEAVDILRGVVAEFEQMRAEDDLPRAYGSLGGAAYLLGRPEAIDWLEKAVEASRRVGDSRLEAYSLANAAAPLMDAKEFRKAEKYLTRAHAIFEGLGEWTGIGAAELNLANLFSDQRRWSQAEERFDAALRIARETANRFQEASVLFNRGQMMKRRDRRDDARALLTEALRIFREIGAEGRAARCDEELRDLSGS